MNDDALAKKRFLQFSLARLSGAVLIVLGTIEMVVVPLLLKRAWQSR